MTLALARPHAFAGLAGRFHDADGDVAVVMVGAWGYEQFCMARAWRQLGDRFSAAGYPTLRYDHPGAGDSLEPDDAGLAPFRAGLHAAVAEVRRLTSPRAVVLLGQGLGAALIVDELARLSGIDGVIALAPVSQGRLWLRELAAWSAMVGGAEPGALSVGGFVVPEALQRDVRALDIRGAAPAVGFSLIAARAGRADDAALAAGFSEAIAYDDYDRAIADPTNAAAPKRVFAGVVEALQAALPPRRGNARGDVDEPATLTAPGFREDALRFGQDGRLYGVLTLPESEPAATLLFLNSGLDPREGWSRIAVDLGRMLARHGYAAFRFDASGCGETPPTAENADAQLLYKPAMVEDAAEALDFLIERGFAPVALTGRCSGAFHAFHLAASRADAAGLIMINPLRLVWNPREKLAEALAGDVRCRALREQSAVAGGNLRRLLTGEITPAAALRKVARLIAGRLPAPPWSADARLVRQARGMFRRLSRQGSRTVFVSSDSDGSRDRFAEVFGSGAAPLAAYPGITVEIIADADHNLNQRAARERAGAIMLKTLGEISGRRR